MVEPDPPPDPQRRHDFTERHAAPRQDFSRSDILRSDVAAVRKEVLADIKANDTASRERDKELHGKIEEWYDELDGKVDRQVVDLAALTATVAALQKDAERAHRDEFADVPWYARPSYLKAMGLAFAAVVAAVLTSLGLIFGWGRAVGPMVPPSPIEAGAPFDPGVVPEEGAPGDGR